MTRQQRLIQQPSDRLSPRLEELYNLLARRGPMTVQEIAKAMKLDSDNGRANIRTYLTRLAAQRPVIVRKAWRSSTYELGSEQST